MQHVLIVDDDEDGLYLLAEILKIYGYRVSTATNALIAMQIFQRDAADIVITDYRMPHMSGGEMLALMRRDRPDLPAIIVSGTAFDAYPIDEMTLAFSKPADSVELVVAMRSLLLMVAKKMAS
jgi:CheY-like chemotaxis protein